MSGAAFVSDKIVEIYGGVAKQEPNLATIAALEEALERAKAGEVVGVGIVYLEHDGAGGYMLSGRVGGFSMLGASQIMSAELTRVVAGE